MTTATASRTKRSQIVAKPIFTSTEEVNDALRDLCDIQARVATREAELQQAITALREEADTDLAEDLATRAQLEKNIEEYCTYYRADVFPKDSKSLNLAHGKVDFRQHPPAVVVSKKKRMTVDAVLENIRQLFGKKADTYIRTKEELNKEVLVTLEVPTLDQLGLELQRKETFGITLNLESVAPAATQGPRVVNL